MARRFALTAEIFGGADEAASEERRPLPIDRHAIAERVLVADQPLSKAQSIGRRRVRLRKRRRRRGGDRLFRLQVLAAMTTHISQNVAAVPLVWIVPLVAYLLSFVVAFSTRTPPRSLVIGLAIIALLGSGYLLNRGVLDISIIPAAAMFCVALFLLCLFLHSELYHRRPEPRHLTSFYFHVAAGGALGAVLVGIVAPLASPGLPLSV